MNPCRTDDPNYHINPTFEDEENTYDTWDDDYDSNKEIEEFCDET